MVNTRSKTKKTQRILQASIQDTDAQSTESEALIGSNDDLLTEILLRLPVTSIFRFKSVSKHWRMLLSDRSFTLRYEKLSKSPGIFFGNVCVPFDVENRSTFFTFDFCDDPHGIKIVQSCNGLLLCSSDKDDKGDCRYYVYNPTTKRFAIIPTVYGGKAAQKTIQLMALAFHPTDCVHYKVVCIRSVGPFKRLSHIQIYSSDTQKLKISIEFNYRDCFFVDVVYWNGAIHWATSYRSLRYFDITRARLQTLPSPEVITTYYYEMEMRYFGESQGHLYLIVTNCSEDKISFALKVYELLSDRSWWFVKYRIELDELTRALPEMIRIDGMLRHRFNVMDVVRGEKEEDTFMVLTIPGKLITYNIHDKSFKQIFNHDSVYRDPIFGRYLIFHRYTETLRCGPEFT